MVHLNLSEETSAHRATEEDINAAVLRAYTSAARGLEQTRHRAFDLAARVYRERNPSLPETTVRRRVGRIICFAEWYRPE